MRKFGLLLILTISLILASAGQAQAAAIGLPVPCLGDAPNVYLIIDGVRHHVLDWDTFLNLGYVQTDIVPCGADTTDPEGEPITRLLKGSDTAVYWMKGGVRHHIPDMETFTSLGFRQSEISQLPDGVIALWPLGAPLASVAATPGDAQYAERIVGSYTIRLWHPGQGVTDFATISAPGQAEVRVQDVESLGELPTSDVTGDGHPDVEFLLRANPGSGHCCWGAAVYDLGATATEVLDIFSPADQIPGTGRGEFRDLDGDGSYEFITRDPLSGIACSQPNVTAILAYDPAQKRYVGASPRFADYYTDLIAQFTTQAASGAPCDVYPLITTLLYAGKTADAEAAFNQWYHAADTASFWKALQTAVEGGRFYAAGN